MKKKKKPAERSQAAIIFPQITESANKCAPSGHFSKDTQVIARRKETALCTQTIRKNQIFLSASI